MMYNRIQGMIAALAVCIGCISMTACENAAESMEDAESIRETTAVSSVYTENVSTTSTTAQTTTEQTTQTTTECITETTEETATEQTAPESVQTTETKQETADLSKYYGYWYIGDTMYENELLIHESDGASISFSLCYYRIAAINYVTAQLNGDTAHFANNDVEGYLLLEEDRISVCITKSNVAFVDAETCTYDVRFDESHLAGV